MQRAERQLGSVLHTIFARKELLDDYTQKSWSFDKGHLTGVRFYFLRDIGTNACDNHHTLNLCLDFEEAK